jgi:hypothetical protein
MRPILERMGSTTRQGPLVLHLLVGLAAIGLLVVGSATSGGEENYAPAFFVGVLVVWPLVAVAIGLLRYAPKPLWLFSWLLAIAWLPLAWAITLGAITVIW